MERSQVKASVGGRERAAQLFRSLINSDETVDRFDASYLADAHHVLREVHGVTPAGGGSGQAREAALELVRLAGVADAADWSGLPTALRRLGLQDEDFQPKRADEKTKKRFNYTKAPSWKEGAGVVAGAAPDAVEKIKKLQADYSYHVNKGDKDLEFDALARPETGDPWTPLFQGFIRDRVVRADEPVLTIGPRWAGEIRYFRQVVGFTAAIGLDLFSKDPDLVKVGDMHEMPFPDNHFGLVYQRNTFDKSYDIRRAVDECARVLRPGGVLVTDDCYDYTNGVSELARTNVKHNRWFLRYLGARAGTIFHDRETPAGVDWVALFWQLAVQVKK
jgi:SAM-dependent methyltransferase